MNEGWVLGSRSLAVPASVISLLCDLEADPFLFWTSGRPTTAPEISSAPLVLDPCPL